MEILKSGSVPTLVTNVEVLQILSSRIQSRESLSAEPTSQEHHYRDWIEHNVFEYLQTTNPFHHLNYKRDNSRLKEFVSKLKNEFDLMDGEILQILNWLPKEAVEIHLMIEDLGVRLSEERQEELLALIVKYSLTGDTPVDGDGNDGENDDDDHMEEEQDEKEGKTEDGESKEEEWAGEEAMLEE